MSFLLTLSVINAVAPCNFTSCESEQSGNLDIIVRASYPVRFFDLIIKPPPYVVVVLAVPVNDKSNCNLIGHFCPFHFSL